MYCMSVMDVCAGSRRSGGDGNMLVMAPDNVVIDCICLVSALNTLSHTTNTILTLELFMMQIVMWLFTVRRLLSKCC